MAQHNDGSTRSRAEHRRRAEATIDAYERGEIVALDGSLDRSDPISKDTLALCLVLLGLTEAVLALSADDEEPTTEVVEFKDPPQTTIADMAAQEFRARPGQRLSLSEVRDMLETRVWAGSQANLAYLLKGLVDRGVIAAEGEPRHRVYYFAEGEGR